MAEMLNTQIGAKKSWNGQYTIDCAKVASLPELTFHFGGRAFPLKGEDYVLNVQGSCISSFTGLDINLPWGSLWIIGMFACCEFTIISHCFAAGDVFLRRYYTVYDLGRDAVGFAESA